MGAKRNSTSKNLQPQSEWVKASLTMDDPAPSSTLLAIGHVTGATRNTICTPNDLKRILKLNVERVQQTSRAFG
jgi:hypothetical protein